MTNRLNRIFTVVAALLTTGVHAQQAGLTSETWNNLTKGTSIVNLQKEGISTRAADIPPLLARK